jgi:hypothetical protein
MVPHDNPYYGQLLLERWVEEEVLGRAYNRLPSPAEEAAYLAARGPDEGPSAGPPAVLPPSAAGYGSGGAASAA